MTTRVGISGSGYLGRGLVCALRLSAQFDVTRVLTRTAPSTRGDFPDRHLLTQSLLELVDSSDVIVECSGDVAHATDVVDCALAAGLPVVTMNAEMQVTTGSYFVGRGRITEAEGDQPGCIAALAEDCTTMGFQPIVYGNIKGFLNQNPTLSEMEYWGRRQGITLPRVVSFTDGTKLQMEQALVANGLGATISVDGLLGPRVEALGEATGLLVEAAEQAGSPIADYVLSSTLPPGVFLIARHAGYEEQRAYLRNYKMGEGPEYVLLRPFHLCHLEVVKTLGRVASAGPPLLDNSFVPRVGVAAVAKHALGPGDRVWRGIGSFDVRGIAVRVADSPDHCPVGLLENATVVRRIEEGQIVSMADVELPDTLAVRAWAAIRRRVETATRRRA